MTNAGAVTGSITFSGGVAVTDSPVSGARISTTKFAPLDCFATDVSFLESQQPIFTSTIEAYQFNYLYVKVSDDQLKSAYEYIYLDGRVTTGQVFGPCFENMQVCAVTWYENADVQGLQIFVAKNASVLFYAWNIATKVSTYRRDYDYSGNDESGFGPYYKIAGTEGIAAANSEINYCTILSSDVQQYACKTAYSVASVCSYESEVIDGVGVAAAFSILSFIALLVVLFRLFTTVKTASLSAQSSSSSKL